MLFHDFNIFNHIKFKKKKKWNSLNKKWKYIHGMYIYSFHNNQLIEPSTLQSILILYTSELSILWAVKRWSFLLILHLWFSFSVLISLNGLKFLTRDSFLWILKTFGFQSPRRKKLEKKKKKSKTKLVKEWKEFCLDPRLVLVKGIRVCRECSPSQLERSVNCYSKGLERERARKQRGKEIFFPNFCCHLDLTSDLV